METQAEATKSSEEKVLQNRAATNAQTESEEGAHPLKVEQMTREKTNANAKESMVTVMYGDVENPARQRPASFPPQSLASASHR